MEAPKISLAHRAHPAESDRKLVLSLSRLPPENANYRFWLESLIAEPRSAWERFPHAKGDYLCESPAIALRCSCTRRQQTLFAIVACLWTKRTKTRQQQLYPYACRLAMARNSLQLCAW